MTEKTRVSSSTIIAASPETVYALVSDLPRMGEWSPEATGGEWVGGADGPSKGAKFKGTNENGTKKWSTVVTVTDASEPSRFAFTNGLGKMVFAEWIYEIAPVTDGCYLTETWVDHEGPVISVVGRLMSGVQDRAAHTRSMIESTLEKIKQTAEHAS